MSLRGTETLFLAFQGKRVSCKISSQIFLVGVHFNHTNTFKVFIIIPVLFHITEWTMDKSVTLNPVLLGNAVKQFLLTCD